MNIDMAAFSKGLSGNPNALLLDVRQPDEYNGVDKDKKSKGHSPLGGHVFMYFK